MGLAHPGPQLFAPSHARLVAGPPHPVPEIVGAHPARVELREQMHELLHVTLLYGGGLFRVAGGDAVEKCPAVSAERVDVGGTVGAWRSRKGRVGGGCKGWGGERGER